MLNISNNSIDKKIDRSKYSVFKKLEEKSISNGLVRLLSVLILIGFLVMFLPWTQNIRSKGIVTTLNAKERPQTIQSLIDGKIIDWRITEGDMVNKGDTLLIIKESKDEYLDPNIIPLTKNQINEKQYSADAYNEKSELLTDQYNATLKNKTIDLEQNQIKLAQEKIKLQTDSINLEAANTKLANTKSQEQRVMELYQKGIKSLVELEANTLSYREAAAYVNEIKNKIENRLNVIEGLIINKNMIINDYDQKLAKINAEKMSTLSMKYNANSEINKLESNLNKYKVRADAYAITSPIDGTITIALKQGIGEFIKAGESILNIVPKTYTKAVELYIRPYDVPLIKKGQKVRLQFDGWPAIVFSGWPENSLGTYEGIIFAIDNDISAIKEGMYRIMVIEDPEKEAWPDLVKIGGGVNGLLLLNEVSIYYEIWRQLNGFPPDFYTNETENSIKTKAPIRKFK